MKPTEIPAFRKFEKICQENEDSEILRDGLQRIQLLFLNSPLPQPENPSALENLTHHCSLVEKATRIIWACAASVDQVQPRIWEHIPDYEETLHYFEEITAQDFMDITQGHKITWENPPSE